MKGGVEAPRLITDNAYGALGNTLLKYSQDGLDYNQRQKQNDWNQAFQQQKLDYQKSQDAIIKSNADRAFYYGAQRDGVKDNQWQQGHNLQKDSLAFDQNYKTNVFNHNVNQDNINNGYKADEMKLRWSNALKPDYATFNGVDENGNQTLNMIDKNTGKVVNTGTRVYNEPKQLAPEQSMYYMDRANEMKQKQLTEMEKNFRATNEFSNLNEADQLKAIDYLRTNGKLPQISHDNSFFGKGYYLPQNGSSNVDIKALEDAINKL